MRKILLFLVMMLGFQGAAFAQGFRVQLGSESARFMYATEAFGQDFGRLELEAGFMYTEDDDYLANMGILVRGESLSVPLQVSIGFRGYLAEVTTGVDTSASVGAITIGGELFLKPESWGGLGLGLYYHTAPGVVSFMDAESLTEYGLFLSYDITPQASMAIGYQNIETELTAIGDVTIDDGAYFSVDIRF